MKVNSKLLKGSIILLITFNIFSFLNFMFQFSMARLLSVEEYGALAALVSLVYIMNLFTESIQLVVTKYTSSESNSGKIKNIAHKSLMPLLVLSACIFAAYALVSFPLSGALKINYWILVFNALIIFPFCFLPLTRGILQGRKMFKQLGLNMIMETSIKLLLAIVLVLGGFGVAGAVGATLAGALLAFGISIISLRDIIKSKEEKARYDIADVHKYSLPAFIVTASVIAMYSIDIIIAKIVFDEKTAGIYAVASILGKIIIWGTIPISKAMFPLSSEKNNKKNASDTIFFNSLALLGVLILAALVVFYIFPELIVRIFSGKSLPQAASILFYIGIGMGLISFANLNLMYKMSRGETRRSYLLLIFVIIEALLLWRFSSNLIEFSIAFITASAAFLWGSVVLLKK